VWLDSPREMQHDCDLANLVWEAGATLKLGLPQEEREFSDGRGGSKANRASRCNPNCSGCRTA